MDKVSWSEVPSAPCLAWRLNLSYGALVHWSHEGKVVQAFRSGRLEPLFRGRPELRDFGEGTLAEAWRIYNQAGLDSFTTGPAWSPKMHAATGRTNFEMTAGPTPLA